MQKIKTLGPLGQILESAIGEKKICEVALGEENKSISLFPHRLSYFGEKLMLVAEDIERPGLLTFELNIISMVKHASNQEFKSNLTSIEISNFIRGTNKVKGVDVRLVLKINRSLTVTPPGTYCHFANMVVITNFEGDFIWSATTEVNDVVLGWIDSMGEMCVVMAPESLARKLEKYRLKFQRAG